MSISRRNGIYGWPPVRTRRKRSGHSWRSGRPASRKAEVMAMWIRLRQVALVAAELAPVLDDLHDVLGLEVAYRDPGVATFGLENAVLPVGTQFLEVVAPTK